MDSSWFGIVYQPIEPNWFGTICEEHPEILVEWLPPYAPEINPEEFCHGNVKQHLRNGTWETVSDIQPQIDRQFARLRHRRDMILHFFHHAGLTVTQLW